MMALLNPKLWLAIGLAALLAFTHVFVYRAGRATVKGEWNASIIATQENARNTEKARQADKDAADLAAANRNRVLLADAGRARAAVDGLSGELAAQREWAAQSLAACTKSNAAVTDVFGQCSSRYTELAAKADGHANDALTCLQAWPK